MEYICNKHGVWDANKESGCPNCVREAREEIASLKKDADRYKWLRDSRYSGPYLRLMYEDGEVTPSACDDAIDNAMKFNNGD